MNIERKWNKPRPVRLNVDDFMRLNDAGAFAGYAKTELIGGVIVAMNAQYSRHARVQKALFLRLNAACLTLGDAWDAWFELSVRLAAGEMPRPDLLIARDVAENAPARPEQVGLVIEIADTTADFDLGTKARLYAAGGIPECWVIDLRAQVVRQMWSPGADGYAERRDTPWGERMRAVAVAGLGLDTSGI